MAESRQAAKRHRGYCYSSMCRPLAWLMSGFCPCDIYFIFYHCSGRIRKRRAPGPREVQVLPQGAQGPVRQQPAVAQRRQRGNRSFSFSLSRSGKVQTSVARVESTTGRFKQLPLLSTSPSAQSRPYFPVNSRPPPPSTFLPAPCEPPRSCDHTLTGSSHILAPNQISVVAVMQLIPNLNPSSFPRAAPEPVLGDHWEQQ